GSIDDDLEDKESTKATVKSYDYKKVSHNFDITDILDPVMRMVVLLVTKLNGKERWTRVNKAWLN
ncbi:hypothetical protein KI387_041145, partial [Taxus chinensis]